MREHKVQLFDKGLIDSIEDFSIPENAASSSLNWLTRGDKIELTGGYKVIGNETGTAGAVTGLHMASTVSGDLQPFKSDNQKVYYYDSSTPTWTEIGTNMLGSDADGEDVSFSDYVSLAGYQTWFSSPNSGLFKVLTANPGDFHNMDTTGTFWGYINIENGRLHLWHRKNNKNYLYGSYKDLQDSTVYTTVSGEAIGALGSQNYTGTLAAVTGLITCFNVVFEESGGETFSDNKDGTLTGDAGGTGTINYSTGAYDITFNATTTGAVTADYQHVDSTSNELADFTFSSPRVASEGFFLPQATGGDLLNVLPYRTDFYCFHENNVYLFTMPVADTAPTNQVFRAKVGMENWRAAVATGDGIYFVDVSDPNEPRLKLMTLDTANDQVVPVTKSFNVDLTGFEFDKSVAFEWGDYVLFSCRESTSTVNNRVFVYDKVYKSFDVTDYFVSCFANNAGLLWAGDSATIDVQQLFTGFSANTALINNYWEGKLSKLAVDELKKFKRLTIQGEIQRDQELDVYLAYDRGSYEKVGTISGTGDYVDTSQAVTVGSVSVGVAEVGGGTADTVQAYNYVREFRIRNERFNEVKIKFQATDAGYVSVSDIEYYDIKTYGQKNLKRYRKFFSAVSNLVGYWKFNEGSGSTAYDSTSNANDGTITSATYASGYGGEYSLSFDGASGDVKVTDAVAIQNIFDSGGAVSFYIYPDSDGESNAARILDKDGRWVVHINSEASNKAKLTFIYDFDGVNGQWTTTSTCVNIGAWNHVAINYNADAVGNDPTIYVNNSSEALTEDTTPTGTRVSDIGQDLYIGNNSADSRTFDGEIDGVRLYNAVLSAAQIEVLNDNPN